MIFRIPSPVVRWWYPCPVCRLDLTREPAAPGCARFPEHWRFQVDEDGFDQLTPCEGGGRPWPAA